VKAARPGSRWILRTTTHRPRLPLRASHISLRRISSRLRGRAIQAPALGLDATAIYLSHGALLLAGKRHSSGSIRLLLAKEVGVRSPLRNMGGRAIRKMGVRTRWTNRHLPADQTSLANLLARHSRYAAESTAPEIGRTHSGDAIESGIPIDV